LPITSVSTAAIDWQPVLTLDFKETGRPPTVTGVQPPAVATVLLNFPPFRKSFEVIGVCGRLIITLGLQKAS